MDIISCKFNEKDEKSLPEFFKAYKDRLPLLVIVVGGHYGPTKWDDLPSDQVMRVDGYHAVKRVLAKMKRFHREEYLSIPVKSKYKFRMVTSVKDAMAEFTLSEILDSHQLPVLVHFSTTDKIPKDGTDSDGKPLHLLIEHTYEEYFLQVNLYAHGVIGKETSAVALCPLISVAPITGYKTRSHDDFLKYLKRMDDYVKNNCTFSEESCNFEIKTLDRFDPEIVEIVNKNFSAGPAPDLPQRRNAKPSLKVPDKNQTHPIPQQQSKAAQNDNKSPLKQRNEKFGFVPPLPDRQTSFNKTHKMTNPPAKPNDASDPEDDIYGGDYEEIDEDVKKTAAGYENDRLCIVSAMKQDSKEESDTDEYEEMDKPPEEKTTSDFKKTIHQNTHKDADYCSPVAQTVSKETIHQNVHKDADTSGPLTQSVKHDVHRYGVMVLPNAPVSPSPEVEPLSPAPQSPPTSLPSPHVSGKSIQELGEILEKLRLKKYVEKFADDMIDGEIIQDFSVNDLKTDYSFTTTEAIRLRKYIESGHIPK